MFYNEAKGVVIIYCGGGVEKGGHVLYKSCLGWVKFYIFNFLSKSRSFVMIFSARSACDIIQTIMYDFLFVSLTIQRRISHSLAFVTLSSNGHTILLSLYNMMRNAGKGGSHFV